MSIRLMSEVWGLDLADSEKIVLLALADCADDKGACWPSMGTLSRKVSKSDRTVQAAIKGLCGKGLLVRVEVAGKGCRYTVTPRSEFTPEKSSPQKPVTLTPEAASDKPSRTIKPSEAKASSGKPAKVSKALVERVRKCRLPANFIPTPTGRSADIVAQWPPGALEDEIDHWRAYHEREATLASDWNASFRTWIYNRKKWNRNDERGPRLLPTAGTGAGALEKLRSRRANAGLG